MNAAVYHDATDTWRVVEADALDVLARLPESSVDSVVVDPPYGISIVGQAWDRKAGEALTDWTHQWAGECLSVLKPGGQLVAFGSPRTFHRLVSGIEDAGFDIRDQLLWLYAHGIPKSHRFPGGRGTMLKPAYEPILLARKPLDGTTAENLARHGTGGLNIDTARIPRSTTPGYWPSEIIATHAPSCTDDRCTPGCPVRQLDDAGGLSQFFYSTKASRSEREAGLDDFPAQHVALYTGRSKKPRVVKNVHPTVKPIDVMRWLIRLITPEGGLVLDPLCGSASTGIAAGLEGRPFLGIEREGPYVDIACARLTHWATNSEAS